MTQETNYLIDTSLTNTIEKYNNIKSPLVYNPDKKVKIKGTNWYIFTPEDVNKDVIDAGISVTPEFKKQNLVENDNLSIRVDPIIELKYKNITNIKISFRCNFYNNSAVPKVDNIKAVLFDKEYSVYFDEFIKNHQINTFDCKLFGVKSDDIYNALQAFEFFIDINFNGNRSNCNISIKEFNVEIEFTNKLNTEKKAMYSRLEEYFTDIDEYVYLYKDYLFSKDTKIEQMPINGIMIGTDEHPYHLYIEDEFKVQVIYKDRNGQPQPLVHQEIQWVANNEKYNNYWNEKSWIPLGKTETDSQGFTTLAYTVKELKDVMLVAIYEGSDNSSFLNDVDDEYKPYSTIKPSRLDTLLHVDKFEPNISITTGKNSYNVKKYLNNTYQSETMIIKVKTSNIGEEFGNHDIKTFRNNPTNCLCELVAGDGTVLRKEEKVFTYGVDEEFAFDSYNDGDKLPTKIRLTINETEYSKVVNKDVNVDVRLDETWDNKYYNAQLSCSNIYSGDNVYFRIVGNNGELPTNIGDGKVRITVNGRTENAWTDNAGHYIYPYYASPIDGEYSFTITFDGWNDIENNIKYHGFATNGVIGFKGWQWTNWHYLNHYQAGEFKYGKTKAGQSYVSWTKDNTNSGKWKKWTANGRTCICNNLFGSGQDGRQPRHLKINVLNTPFNNNIKISSIRFAFDDEVFNTNDEPLVDNTPDISVAKDWVLIWFNMMDGLNYFPEIMYTGGAKKITKGYTTHTVKRDGDWTGELINKLNYIIRYGANNSVGSISIKVPTKFDKKGKPTKYKTEKIPIQYGGLRIKNPRVQVFYRYPQNVW